MFRLEIVDFDGATFLPFLILIPSIDRHVTDPNSLSLDEGTSLLPFPAWLTLLCRLGKHFGDNGRWKAERAGFVGLHALEAGRVMGVRCGLDLNGRCLLDILFVDDDWVGFGEGARLTP